MAAPQVLDWLEDEPEDRLLVIREDEAELRFRRRLFAVTGLEGTEVTEEVQRAVRQRYGTNYRTLLGLRRLVEGLRVGQVALQLTTAQLDERFIMVMDWLKTYGNRKGMSRAHACTVGTFDKWRQRLISYLASKLRWVRSPPPPLSLLLPCELSP